jgi:hypothetical protein
MNLFRFQIIREREGEAQTYGQRSRQSAWMIWKWNYFPCGRLMAQSLWSLWWQGGALLLARHRLMMAKGARFPERSQATLAAWMKSRRNKADVDRPAMAEEKKAP